jgi:hypothetical protein
MERRWQYRQSALFVLIDFWWLGTSETCCDILTFDLLGKPHVFTSSKQREEILKTDELAVTNCAGSTLDKLKVQQHERNPSCKDYIKQNNSC